MIEKKAHTLVTYTRTSVRKTETSTHENELKRNEIE